MLFANLRGKRYRVSSRRLPPRTGGLCDPPTNTNKQISICSSITSPNVILENLLHEALHACFWDMDESAIKEAGADIRRLLIRAGITVDVQEVKRRLAEDKPT